MYEVICGVTNKLLTEGTQQARIHTYKKGVGAKTYWLNLDKDAPEVAEQLDIIAKAQSALWELNNQSPTAFVNKGKEVAVATSSVVEDTTDTIVEDTMEDVAPY